jgi:hypothetical protein
VASGPCPSRQLVCALSSYPYRSSYLVLGLSVNRSWLIVGGLLAFSLVLTLIYYQPDAMISPGKLVQAHAELDNQCASCHAPFQGAVAGRCVTCHAVANIGWTKGQIGANPLSFHQSLTTQNCLTCHSDHKGRIVPISAQPHFSHALIGQSAQANCASCHRLPKAAFHQAIKGECSSCHTLEKWKPATFDHSRIFTLTGPHNVACASCHVVGQDYRQYSCTTCHAHEPARLKQEHAEQGIVMTANCVSCHRSRHAGKKGEGRDDD